MYLLRSEGLVALGHAGEFEELSARLGSLLEKQEGFDRGALLNSLGYPGRYVRMTRFLSRDAARAWARSPELSAFFKESAYQAIYTPTRPVEAYELVHVVRGSGEGSHADIAEWQIDPKPDNAVAYEAGRKELFELRRQHGHGFVASLLLRFLGGGGKYIMYMVSTDRDAALATTATLEVRQWVQAHPASMYGAPSPSPESHELLQAYVP